MELSYALARAVAELNQRRLIYRPVNIAGLSFPDRQALVAFLAGPTTSGTPERAGQQYRSAAREVQRLERGDIRLTDRQRYRLEGYAARLRGRRVSVLMSACIRVSSEKRCRWRERMRATITEADLGSPEEFTDAFFDAYGIAGPVMVDDFDLLTIQLL